VTETGSFAHVDRVFWSLKGLHVIGWVVPASGSTDAVALRHGSLAVQVTDWHPRPDVVAAFPEMPVPLDCGFSATLAGWTLEGLNLDVDGESVALAATLGGAVPPELDASGLWWEFVDQANEASMSVLELGSRVVTTESNRPLFTTASYTGFDFYADDNTDVVGDAHELSRHFDPESLDAVFSLSVLEHLAMPWKVALEINKVLRPGGLTFHTTHQAWPVHDSPWDFWRFTAEGLGVLFGPPAGFEVVRTGYTMAASIHLDDPAPPHVGLPAQPAYGTSIVLARKIADPDPALSWPVSTGRAVGDTKYPER